MSGSCLAASGPFSRSATVWRAVVHVRHGSRHVRYLPAGRNRRSAQLVPGVWRTDLTNGSGDRPWGARELRIPPALQAIIGGESLFNDGIGIVLYTIFLHNAMSGGESGATAVGMFLEFMREAGGGAVLGLTAGGLAFVAMRGIDEYNVELLISLTLVTGTYALVQKIGVSGPVAVVVAGLLMGSVGVRYAVSGATHEYLQKFWSLADELLNSFLFFTEIDALKHEGMQSGLGMAGRIRFGCGIPPTGSLWRRLLVRWRDLHPQVLLVIAEMNERDIAAALDTRRLDVALIPSFAVRNHNGALPIYREQLVVVAPIEHRLSRCGAVSWNSLQDESILCQGWGDNQSTAGILCILIGEKRAVSISCSKSSIDVCTGCSGFWSHPGIRKPVRDTLPGCVLQAYC